MVIGARLELQTDQATTRARFVASELPWPLQLNDVIRRIEAFNCDGIRSVSEEHDTIVIELEHLAWAWWVKAALDATGLLRQTYRAELRINVGGAAVSCDLRQVLNLFLEYRIGIIKTRQGRQLSALRDRAHVVEGLLVTAEFREPVLELLRAAEDPTEETWGLMHLASPDLRTRPSFATHTPLDPKRLAEVVTTLVDRLRADLPDSAKASHSYSLGFTESQARAIATTRRLGSLSQSALFSEWLELRREIDRLDEPRGALARAEAKVLEELTELKKRHSHPRRTWVRPTGRG